MFSIRRPHLVLSSSVLHSIWPSSTSPRSSNRRLDLGIVEPCTSPTWPTHNDLLWVSHVRTIGARYLVWYIFHVEEKYSRCLVIGTSHPIFRCWLGPCSRVSRITVLISNRYAVSYTTSYLLSLSSSRDKYQLEPSKSPSPSHLQNHIHNVLAYLSPPVCWEYP